jgi:hypothetical protein
MTPRKLNEVSANPVASNLFRPLREDHPVLGAHHVTTWHRGKSGKRQRILLRAIRLRPKALEGTADAESWGDPWRQPGTSSVTVLTIR